MANVEYAHHVAFPKLTDSEVECLASLAKVCSFKDGETVFQAGQRQADPREDERVQGSDDEGGHEQVEDEAHASACRKSSATRGAWTSAE